MLTHGRWLINGTQIRLRTISQSCHSGRIDLESGICEQSNDRYYKSSKVSLAIPEQGLPLPMGGFSVKSEMTGGKSSRKPYSQKISTNRAVSSLALVILFLQNNT